MSETPGQDTGPKQWDAYQRGEAERDRRDPKAPTCVLMLLYPVAAVAIWIGMFLEPGRQVSEQAQWLLTLIGGVWIAWVSIRLLIRERHRYQVWVHYALGALAVVGVVAVMFAVDGENNLHDNWLLTMGDPSQCDAEDRADLNSGLQWYGDTVSDADDDATFAAHARSVARYLNYFVKRGCISITDLEKQKYHIVKQQMVQ
jgi:hypothetical protein